MSRVRRRPHAAAVSRRRHRGLRSESRSVRPGDPRSPRFPRSQSAAEHRHCFCRSPCAMALRARVLENGPFRRPRPRPRRHRTVGPLRGSRASKSHRPDWRSETEILSNDDRRGLAEFVEKEIAREVLRCPCSELGRERLDDDVVGAIRRRSSTRRSRVVRRGGRTPPPRTSRMGIEREHDASGAPAHRRASALGGARLDGHGETPSKFPMTRAEGLRVVMACGRPLAPGSLGTSWGHVHR